IEIDEDAKMGKLSDEQLRKIYKKAAAMDQSSPANKSFTKRIEKEMKKRGIQEEVEFDEGSSDTQDMYALMIKGMKAVPGSPKQKKIINQINVIRKRMGMPLMKEETEKEEIIKFAEKLVAKARKEGLSIEKKEEVKFKSFSEFEEEVELDEEIFYWYLIRGNLETGKVAFVGTEKQVKLKRHDPKFSGDFVMTKSRKQRKMGDKWKKSMGVSEEVELDEMFFKITIPDLPPVFVEGDSGSKIRRSMKLKLRPDVYKDLDVERVSRADMAKKYRSLAKAEKEKEEEDEVKEGLDEVAPPGWEGTVKKMKGDKNIDNPWALAWWMKSKGYKSNANEEVWYREQNALEEDFVTNRMGGGNIEYRSPLLFSKKKQKLVKRKYPAGTMMAYEEVELTEALKPADKKVIDAFYKENSLVGKLLSSTGKSLEKHGVGGQTIAAWLKGKIAITAVSDVKSTESILNYMKKSIPKNNFDPKSYKKFFEEVEVAEAKMSDPMIAKLKQKYEPLRGKRLSLGQNTEIAKIVSGMGKDKEVLLQLVKADIPFISLNAATFLMDKHGMKAKDINLGNKLVRKQEIKSKIIDDSYHGTFAGNDVFIVNSDTFHTCRLGKQKYHRYEKYVGNGKIGQAIREFGLTNPKKPIILQNGEGGPMLYLRYGGSKRYA
ncbi:MAG: sporulation histidine kinase inhibitor Sda, partial [Nitrosopumilus sp.]|nr:sporulation histidine kinase inhibitor Sda [Nitrosopumilus sp.]